jgi:hypothetical protein
MCAVAKLAGRAEARAAKGAATMREIGLIAIMALAVAGCSSGAPTAAPTSPPQPEAENGRWAMVPVGGGPEEVGDQRFWYAWRLDTKTGTVEMCSYTDGSAHWNPSNRADMRGPGIVCQYEDKATGAPTSAKFGPPTR